MAGTLDEFATTGGAEHIPSTSLGYRIDFGAELWSPGLTTLVEDISGDLVTEGSSVSYQGNSPVRHTGSLRWGNEHDWVHNRLKLLCSLTSMRDGETRTYTLGYYIADTTSRVMDTDDAPVTTALYDLTTQLDSAIGQSYYVAAGTNAATAIVELLARQGQWGRFEPADARTPIVMDCLVTPTDAVLTKGRVWPISDANTWRRALNHLAAVGSYRQPWVNRQGVLVVDPQIGTSVSVVLPTGAFTVLGEGARYTNDIYQAPNQWIGVGATADAGSEPTVIVTAQDVEETRGAHSFERRGLRVVRKVYELDAAPDGASLDASTLTFQEQLRKLVTADREVTERVSFKCAPMPVFWHSDIIELTDLGLAGRWRVASWSLPFNGGDMSVEVIRVRA